MEDKRLLRLVKKARHGDKDAFCEIVNLKGRSIVYIATNLMGNSADGEDAAQEAVITLARKIGTLKKAELFDAWMYRIVYNVCMDEKRKKARKVQGTAELDTAMAIVPEKSKEVLPEEKLQDTAEKEAIMAAINELPERYRLYLLLYYYEDMSYAEIAATMQVSEQVVANTLNRAREKMRESLAQKDPENSVIAGKAGAILPAIAITQAFAFNEQAMVLPDTVAGLAAVAAAAPLFKASLLTRFLDNIPAQITSGVTAVAAVVLGLSLVVPTKEEPAPEPEPEPIVETEPPAVIEEPEEVVRSAKVDGLPEGAKTTILSEGQDDAALQAFEANLANYEYITETTSDGYHYVIYRNLSDPLDYVLTIKSAS